MNKSLVKTGTLVVLAMVFVPACAHARDIDRTGSYRIEVISNGWTLPIYYARGQAWVEGRIGERYVIRVHNNSSRRVEAVVSVDGRDVIDGREASLSKRGYVIDPWSSIDIDGFRLSMDEVAAFRFTDAGNSYAARMGSWWGIGVIAAAIFPEKAYPRPWPPRPLKTPRGGCYDCEERDAAAASEAAPRSRQGLGTEFGEGRWSPASETTFTRQSWNSPAARLAIRYDDRQGLCEKGVADLCRPWPPPPDYWPPEPWPP
ncbi:MAG: hypothetical protein ABIN58_00870, partial [candidate division WOR-3 bacterium]